MGEGREGKEKGRKGGGGRQQGGRGEKSVKPIIAWESGPEWMKPVLLSCDTHSAAQAHNAWLIPSCHGCTDRVHSACTQHRSSRVQQDSLYRTTVSITILSIQTLAYGTRRYDAAVYGSCMVHSHVKYHIQWSTTPLTSCTFTCEASHSMTTTPLPCCALNGATGGCVAGLPVQTPDPMASIRAVM